LAFRGKLDNNLALQDFCHNVEQACIETVRKGIMTKDLALSIHGEAMNNSHCVSTEEYMDAVVAYLEQNK